MSAITGLTKFADPLHKMAFRNDPLHKSLVSSLEGPQAPTASGMLTAPAGDPDAAKKRDLAAEEDRRRSARGFASTVLTSPLGVPGSGLG